MQNVRPKTADYTRRLCTKVQKGKSTFSQLTGMIYITEEKNDF